MRLAQLGTLLQYDIVSPFAVQDVPVAVLHKHTHALPLAGELDDGFEFDTVRVAVDAEVDAAVLEVAVDELDAHFRGEADQRQLLGRLCDLVAEVVSDDRVADRGAEDEFEQFFVAVLVFEVVLDLGVLEVDVRV